MQAGQRTERLGPAAYARRVQQMYGVALTRQAVHQSKIIPKGPDGLIDPVAADAAMIAAGRLTPPAADAAETHDEPDAGGSRPRGEASGPTFYGEKAETERVRRRLLEIELAEKEGSLVPVKAVEDAMVAAGLRIAQRIDLLPSRAQEIVAAARSGDMTAVRTVLRRAAIELRQVLADSLRLDADTMDDETDANGEGEATA